MTIEQEQRPNILEKNSIFNSPNNPRSENESYEEENNMRPIQKSLISNL